MKFVWGRFKARPQWVVSERRVSSLPVDPNDDNHRACLPGPCVFNVCGAQCRGGNSMNPTMSPQVNGLAALSRNVLCQHYSHCLDLAIRKGWPGFSCDQCQHYELEPSNDTDHWREQAGRCRLLLAKLFAPKPPRRRNSVVPTRNRNDFPMSEKDLRCHERDRKVQDCMERRTVQLPEAFLAHLMLLYENRPRE